MMSGGQADDESQPDNELFPSTDWRYLLPDPAPAIVVAEVDGPLATVVDRMGSPATGETGEAGETTENDETRAELADLAVTDRADRDTIARLHRRIRPGGTLYLEVPWGRLRPVADLNRRLTEAGFCDPMLYSLSPSSDRWSSSWWTPIGHPEALGFVAASVGQGRRANPSIAQRLRRGSARAVSAVPALTSHHPWLLWPTRRRYLCAVAVKPAAIGDDETTTQPGLLPVSAAPFVGRRSAAMRVGGSSTDQAMLFAFGDGPDPDLVVKAPTRSEELAATGHEAAMLTRLTDRPDPMPGVPRPVALATAPGVAAWGQTFLSGSALATVVESTSLHRHGLAVTQWLIELAQRTRATGDNGHNGRVATAAIEELDPLWRLLPDGTTLRAGAEARLRAFGGSTTVCHHRDLGPWNVLVNGDNVRVIDWADAVPSGPPLCDLHHFLAHLVLCVNDAYGPIRRHGIIDQLIDPSLGPGQLVDRCLDRYAVALDLDVDEVRALRVLTWLLDLLRRPLAEQVSSIYLDLLRAELC